jgi:hypothetical protein
VIHSNQQWIQYYNQTKIAEKWSFGIDGGFRWKEGDKLQYIARTGLLYQLTKKIKVGGGIATTGTYLLDNLSRVECRPYQELFANLNEGKILLTSRFRIEERFFKNRLLDPPTHNFNYRFRYQISFQIPLVKLSDDDSKKLLLGISDEIFINAGKEIVYNALDRNRIVIGPAWQMSKSLVIAVSYAYQFAQRNLPEIYDSDNVIWVTIKHNMILVKRTETK